MPYTPPSHSTPPRHRNGGIVIAAILAGAVIAGFVIGFIALAHAGGDSPRPSLIAVATGAGPTPTQAIIASVSPSESTAPSDVPTTKPTDLPSPSSSPTPGTPPLPAMLAAIGDSYTQGYNVSTSALRDHPQYSWVVGTAKSDGVTSLLERFKALGASPVVVDAATSGRKMIDAQRQVDLVVAEAQNLQRGQTAYVTFMLGINDLCDDPKTPLADFTTQARTAVETLRVNLPPGSRLLMVPVPDYRHFRAITQADPTARAALLLYKNSTRCAPFLGANSPTSIPDAEAILASYNAALKAICDEENAMTGPQVNLHCTYNEDLLSDRDFVIRDLSTVDYFHPSLTGQAKMAAAAWKADAWANGVATSRRSTLAGSTESGLPGATAGFAFVGPLACPLGGRRRRRPRALEADLSA
jgi:lysophospholipase L1-like esterase